MPSSPSLRRHAKTGRSGCVPVLCDHLRPIELILVFPPFQKELKKLAKAQGSVVPPSVGTPLPSTPTAAPTPTQPPAQPPRTSTPVPISRGIKREFEDSALTQPNTQGPGTGVAVSSGDGVSSMLGQQQRPGVAKAGVPGARPRPVKKQRVVSNDFTLLYSKPRRVRGRCHPAGVCPCVNLWVASSHPLFRWLLW